MCGLFLNGEETYFAGSSPLGYGETGFMVYEDPVDLRNIRVKATTGAVMSGRMRPVRGLLIFILAILAVWFMFGCRVRILHVVTAVSPVLFYLAGALFLSRDALIFMGKDRLAWLDLVLAGSVLSLFSLLIIYRERVRGASCDLKCYFVGSWFLSSSVCLGQSLASGASHEGEAFEGHRGSRKGLQVQPAQRKRGTLMTEWWARMVMSGTSGSGRKSVLERKLMKRPESSLLEGVKRGVPEQRAQVRLLSSFWREDLRGRGVSVEVYNSGINGAGLGRYLRYYEDVLKYCDPNVIVAHVGLNDSAALFLKHSDKGREQHVRILIKSFEGLVAACREDDVDLILSLEPLCGQNPLELSGMLYGALRESAEENDLAVVDVGPVLREKEIDHFVWWDGAHLAPYGHQLVSSLLSPHVWEAITEDL